MVSVSLKNRFSTAQISLHWLVFLLVLMAYLTMELRWLAPKGTLTRNVMAATHFSCGATILVLMLTRIWLKIKYATPNIVPALPIWQTVLAHSVQLMMFLVFIGLPLLGLTAKFLLGKHWMIFGISMPVSSSPDIDLYDSLMDYHETLARLGYWLIGFHAMAALFHHYFMKDNTLLRMLPAKEKR